MAANPGSGRTIEILLVEDNPADVRLTVEALKDGKINNTLYPVKDGVEALAFLRREGEYADATRPDIILLDLNLPKKNGLEVLQEVKSSPDLRRIPVVVLTTSTADEDVIKSYDLNVNCYIPKPVEIDKFVNVIRSIENFWFSIVRLP